MEYRHTARRENLYLLLFAAPTFFFISVGIAAQNSFLFLIPFSVIVAFFLILRPYTVIELLIFTFYLGFPLIHRTMFGIFPTDFIFILLCAAFLSRFFNTGDLRLDLPESSRRIIYILAVFFMIAVFSVSLNLQSKSGVDVIISSLYLFNLLQLIIIVVIFSQEEIAASSEKLINLVLALSIFEVMAASIQYLQQGYSTVDTLRSVRGTFFSHHSLLGNMMVFPLAFSLYRLLISRQWFGKACYFTGIALSMYVIVISGSRSVILGCAISIAIWLSTSFRISRRYVFYLLILGFVLSGLFLLTPLKRIVTDTVAGNGEVLLDISSFGRILIWKGALQQFVQAPLINKLFGIGMGNYYTMKYSFQLVEGARITSGAHNNFLHVLIETGIVGLTVFIIFWVVVLSALRKRASYDRLNFVFFYATLALIFSGLTQETFWFQPSFGRFWLMYMIFLVFCTSREPLKKSITAAG